MSIASTLLTDIDTAFTTAFAAVSVDFRAYESAGLTRLPLATMVPAELSEIEMTDQAARIGRVEYTLRYYVSLGKNAKDAWDDLKEGITKCVDAVGRAANGGTVRAAWVEDASVGAIMNQQNKPELVCEMRVMVVPGVNTSGA